MAYHWSEHVWPGGKRSIVVQEDGRLRAKLRPIGAGGYILHTPGLCMLDKRPSPKHRTALGTMDPTRWHVSNIRTARWALRRLFPE